EVLPADHAERRLRELATDVRGRIREREPEGLGEERVTGEHGDRLAELCPRGGTTAPLRVVVERRQIVVNEREGVYELECRAGRERAFGVGAGRFCGREADDGAHPLAADERVPHRLRLP